MQTSQFVVECTLSEREVQYRFPDLFFKEVQDPIVPT